MNPYEANPSKIPSSDRYADVPFYGRYLPQPADFKPDPNHINSTTPESLTYWQSVLQQCDESHRIYENLDGGRDVFALGSVIVKSSHMKAVLVDGRNGTTRTPMRMKLRLRAWLELRWVIVVSECLASTSQARCVILSTRVYCHFRSSRITG
jgi:hypothetical protein